MPGPEILLGAQKKKFFNRKNKKELLVERNVLIHIILIYSCLYQCSCKI